MPVRAGGGVARLAHGAVEHECVTALAAAEFVGGHGFTIRRIKAGVLRRQRNSRGCGFLFAADIAS